MFRKLLTIGVVAALCLSFALDAGAQRSRTNQSGSKEKVNVYGVKGGYTSSYYAMTYDPATNGHTNTPGFLAGVTIERPFRNNLFFNTELIIARTGDEFMHVDKEHSVQQDLRKTEFEHYLLLVPIFYKYYVPQLPAGSFISFGPQLGFVLKAKQSPYVTSLANNTDVSQFTNTATLSWMAGIGFQKKTAIIFKHFWFK